MIIIEIDGEKYHLPSTLNAFQRDMYVHLINWKWTKGIKAPGMAQGYEYDAILPDSHADARPMLYPKIQDALDRHLEVFPFRIHTYFNHMASSQAACINLFLPVLLHPKADAILGELKPDFASLERSALDGGFRVEFWDGKAGSKEKGFLNDHSQASGTDSDIAIAYRNHQDELCLWMIEHKLTEHEFTTCEGFRSKGRKRRHNCRKSFAEILGNKQTCYYHDKCKFRYWDITEAHADFFVNHSAHNKCPFQKGMNQVWRNQLLAMRVEEDERQPFRHVTFSVVRHPKNEALIRTLRDYKNLIADNPKFTDFTSAALVEAAEGLGDAALREWAQWYRALYGPRGSKIAI